MAHGRARHLLPLLLGVVAALVVARLTLLTPAFSDYELEAEPAFDALRAGHVGGFLGALPAYGGSLILRAPFALAPTLWGGGSLAVFRAVSVPCLAAAVAFGMVLWSGLAGPHRRATLGAWLALALVVANPVALSTFETGHPEELLGAVLCAAAVIAGLRGRPVASGLLLGLALANKPWALLAVVPVMLALSAGRLRALAVAGGVAAVVLAPMLLHGGVAVTGAAATDSSQIFQPWQLWWFTGHHGEVVHGLYGIKDDYRTGPGWIARVGHPLVVVVPLVGSIVFWRVRGAGARRDALLLLALVFLLRCVLDPWDVVYYHLPMLMALVAHEAVVRRRAPVATLAVSAAVYGSIVVAGSLSPDVQAALYLAWSLPLGTVLLARLLAPARFAAFTAPLSGGVRRHLPALAAMVQPVGGQLPRPVSYQR